MKRYEIESLLKNFLLFFLLLEFLVSVIVWQQFNDEKRNLNNQIQTKMKLCSYSMKCDDFSLDFVPLPKGKEMNHLYADSGLYSYFKVPTVDQYMMQVILEKEKYEVEVESIRDNLLFDMLMFSIFIMIVSFLFSLYALKPLKKALNLNEEFVKDILHDFNTPISSMVINFKLLKKESGENKKIHRLENNIETILTLQKNLQTFLKGISTQKEPFELLDLLQRRVQYFTVLHPNILYFLEVKQITLNSNIDAFTRIVDNILSNAGKYNINNGTVNIFMEGSTLVVQDSGIGIKDPSKIFKRFYKEQDRGIGIGMHIVHKLCIELSVKITVESQEKVGTKVMLDLAEVIVK